MFKLLWLKLQMSTLRFRNRTMPSSVAWKMNEQRKYIEAAKKEGSRV